MSNVMDIRRVADNLFHVADGRTEKNFEFKSHLLQFCKMR